MWAKQLFRSRSRVEVKMCSVAVNMGSVARWLGLWNAVLKEEQPCKGAFMHLNGVNSLNFKAVKIKYTYKYYTSKILTFLS